MSNKNRPTLNGYGKVELILRVLITELCNEVEITRALLYFNSESRIL